MKNIEIDEKMIALQVTINNRNFAITVDKKFLKKMKMANFINVRDGIKMPRL